MKSTGRRRRLEPGLYGPLPTFFDENQELDLISYKHHLLRLARVGIVPVCMGSLGEASHLTPEERKTLIRLVRRTLDEEGMVDRPIVAGVGGTCTRDTIALARDAAEAGADAGMVILPAYYAASLNADQEQVIQYFVDICEASPIPILLYNFPANSAGQDMSSATILSIMHRAPNLCGVKLTCPGSIAKLVRLKQAMREEPCIETTRPYPFLFLDGLAADLVPWASLGGHGTVSGLPNFAPLTIAKLWSYCSKADLTGTESKERDRLQGIVSNVDVAALPGGVRAMKYALHRLRGYGSHPRRPLLPLSENEGEAFLAALRPMLEEEERLEAAST